MACGDNMIEFIVENYKQGLLYLVLFSGVVQISPIKINPWSWLAKKIGAALNGEVIKKIDTVEKKVDQHINESNQEKMTTRRQRILQAADEVADGKIYGKERWKNIMQDVDTYDLYCKSHDDYQNGMAEEAMKFLKEACKKQVYTREG